MSGTVTKCAVMDMEEKEEAGKVGLIESLRTALRRYKEAHNLSQENLAPMVGMKRGALGSFLRGESVPSGPELDSIAALVGTPAYILANRLQSLVDLMRSPDLSDAESYAETVYNQTTEKEEPHGTQRKRPAK